MRENIPNKVLKSIGKPNGNCYPGYLYVSQTIYLSREEQVAAVLKHGKNGVIIEKISREPNLADQLEGIDTTVLIRVEFTRWIRNEFKLWEEFEKVVGSGYSASGIDMHELHPENVSYDIAKAVCEVIGIKFREL